MVGQSWRRGECVQTLEEWLDELASEAGTPGGGAAAAVNAAVGAALIAMVCRLTVGRPKFVAVQPEMTAVLASADRLREEAIALAEADAQAFAKVLAAYQLPKDDDDAQQRRRQEIQDSLGLAADVPARVAVLATEVVELAERIVAISNPQVVSDVAVAASSARSALESGLVNVEVNLALLTDARQRDALSARIAALPAYIDRADQVVVAVRKRIAA
jgi:methenyltetrahydrofolate cyclohydrolase